MKEEIPAVVLDLGGVKGCFFEERLYSGSPHLLRDLLLPSISHPIIR